MTVATLASISLLALVVTAAPLASPNDASQLERLSMGAQNAAQAMLQASTGETPKCLDCVQDAEPPASEASDILTNLGTATSTEDTVPVDFSDLQTDEGILSSAQDELDIFADHSSVGLKLLPSTSTEVAKPSFLSPRQINFSLTCMTLGVTVGCVFGLLFLRYMLSSRKAASPDVERQSDLEKPVGGVEEASSSYDDEKKQLVVLAAARPERAPCVDEEKRALQAEYAHSEAGESSDEELEETFVDAEDTPVLLIDLSIPEGPQIVVQRPADRDPELLPLPLPATASPCTPFSTPPPTPPRSPLRRPLQMREAGLSSPLARPAWSQRATDAPTLGLASFARAASPAMRSLASSPVTRPGTPTMCIPGAFASDDEDGDEKRALELERAAAARNRAYRAPMPELDVAFALQLRPGLGLGSDPAWLVRFLMAMFGWMTVFIGNGANSQDFGRAIA